MRDPYRRWLVTDLDRLDGGTASSRKEAETKAAELAARHPGNSIHVLESVSVSEGDGTGRVERLDDPVAFGDAPRDTLPDPDLARDAARWRALLASPYMRMLGWAGLDRDGNAAPKEGGGMHFGMEAWSVCGYDPEEVRRETELARKVVTSYADAIIASSPRRGTRD